VVDAPLSLIGGSSSDIVIRNLNIEEHLTSGANDFTSIIDFNTSNITIDNMRSNTSLLIAVVVSNDDHTNTLTIGHSSFTGRSLEAPQLIIEGCVFRNSFPFSSGAIQMTNSILIADSANKHTLSDHHHSQPI
jgi:hypothetical protein